MSPQRVADAARISPFTDIQEPQQGRSTASASENAESSQSRAKKGIKKPPRDRNPRAGQDEEMRFNTGPRSMRSLTAGRGRRTNTRAGRGPYNDGRNENVPNYPPPSFQEAISSSTTLSLYPSTTTLVPTSISYVSPEVIEEYPQQPPVPLPHPQQPSGVPVPQDVTSESDSESSIELVERTDGQLPSGRQLEDQVKDAWRRQHGVEFPRPAVVAPDLLSLRSTGAADAQQRGRAAIPRLDTEAEHLAVEIEAATPTTPKRRHLSLLPLKTLLPSRMFGDRALSALATPTQGTSPYASSPMSFFRSTGSLATGSFLKLPLSPTSAPPARKTSFLARTLFSKGKEKEHVHPDVVDRESLDSWEVLPAEEPISLLSAVESVSDPMLSNTTAPSSVNGGPYTPIQSPMPRPSPPPAPVLPPSSLHIPSPPSPPPTPAPSSVGTGPKDELYPIHPLSARDRKVSATLFLNRQVRKQNALKSPSRVHLPPSPIPTYSGPPPLTTVRTRNTPDTTQKSVPDDSPNLTPESPSDTTPDVRASRESSPLPRSQEPDAGLLQRALETPLPVTPLTQSFIEPITSSPTSPSTPMYTPSQSPVNPTPSPIPTPTQPPTTPIEMYVTPIGTSPTTPIPGRAGLVGDSIRSSCSSDVPRWQRRTNDEHAVTHRDQINTAHRPVITRPPSVTISERSPSPSHPEHMSPQRRHYAGRPLPRPPGPRPPVDSTYAPSEDLSIDGIRGNDTPCPEGLLIDLNDPSPSGAPSGFSTPRSEEGRFQSQLSLAVSPATSHVDFFESTTDLSLPSSSRHDLSIRYSPVSPANLTSLSDMTDLDLLLSQLNDGHRDGNDYEALLLVQELMGTATPIRATAISSPLSPISSTNRNISLIGRIDIERRRVTKDGRIKLKLGLLGVAVDRCGICLSQFRGDDLAGLGSVCKHAFHQKCIAKWLNQSKTCPMCRVPLDVD